MTSVQVANERRPADWPYSDADMQRMMAAVRQEAYPPAQRNGIGPAGQARG